MFWKWEIERGSLPTESRWYLAGNERTSAECQRCSSPTFRFRPCSGKGQSARHTMSGTAVMTKS